ncbi:MAG: hypothetical protein AAGE52_12480 [Myxococcota bacterium]
MSRSALVCGEDYDWRSYLNIVWFQDDYAWPIAALSEIRAIDWDSRAHDERFA